jgi:hypothetical protein
MTDNRPHDHAPQVDVYVVLAELRESLATSALLTGYALDLKASADRLLPLVRDELRKLRRSIDQVLLVL